MSNSCARWLALIASSGRSKILGMIIDHLSGLDKYPGSDHEDIEDNIKTYRSICGDGSRRMVEIAYRIPPLFQPYGDIDICVICGASIAGDEEKEEHLLRNHRNELEKIAIFISTASSKKTRRS
ncbi:MAG: hypothetical protein QXI64_10705 [Sulfolobales archaeon]